MINGIKEKTPGILKVPAKILYDLMPDNLKYGRTFREKIKFLEESQYWSKEKTEEYQMKEITKILNHAYLNVPYYQKVFDERSIKPKDIQNLNDFKQIPYLTKDIIHNNLKDLIAENHPEKDLSYVTTGGSTGIPMGFYESKSDATIREWAFMAAQWARVGYKIDKRNKCIILRGNLPRNGLYEYKGNNLILSSYSLTEENMKIYLDMINKFQPDFIQAYPSSINILSDYILQNEIKLNLHNLKAILCGSENIYGFQREKVEKVFGRRVYSWYGHTEKCCLAGECELNRNYHVFPEYGYAEIINENNDDVTEENGIGEIVATGFNNYAVPFIRYKTCDMAVNTNETCKCGRPYKMIKRIEGRKQEYFFDKYENKIIFTCSDDALWRVNNKIFAYQYVQNIPGKVILNIEPKGCLNNKDFDYIREDFLKFYPSFDIKIELVKHIDRTSSGKFKYLVQNIGTL